MSRRSGAEPGGSPAQPDGGRIGQSNSPHLPPPDPARPPGLGRDDAMDVGNPKAKPRARDDPVRIEQVREEKEQERMERDGLGGKAAPDAMLTSGTDEAGPKYSYVPHMRREEADNLRPGDYFDHRDDVGKSLSSRVLDKRGTKVHVHYEGWASKWDTWSDYEKELWRFGEHKVLSARPSEREDFKSLAVKDYIYVNPKKHPGWKPGQIRRLDIDRKTQAVRSGQVQVQYRGLDEYGVQKEFLYWCHLDNPDEVRPMSGNGTEPGNGGAGGPGGNPSKPKSLSYETPQHDPNYGKPLVPDEKVENPWSVMDWLEAKDMAENWEVAMVLEVKGNWIKIHYDQWSTKWDECLHIVRDKDRIRSLGSTLQKCDMEIEIEEDLKGFRQKCEEQEGAEIIEMKADGNCLYRGVAKWIYDDQEKYAQVREETCNYMEQHKDFFKPFLGEDFEEVLKKKRQNMEWGDHDDITAMSEKYNCRFRVLEYNREADTLYDSLVLGEHNKECTQLPQVLLSRHRGKHYNVVQKKGDRCFIGQKRPANINIRNFRLKMEQEFAEKKKAIKNKEEEEKHSEADRGDRDVEMDVGREQAPNRARHSSQRSPRDRDRGDRDRGLSNIMLADNDLDELWDSARRRRQASRRHGASHQNYVSDQELQLMLPQMLTRVFERFEGLLVDSQGRPRQRYGPQWKQLQKLKDKSSRSILYDHFQRYMEQDASRRQSRNSRDLYFDSATLLKRFNDVIVKERVWEQVWASHRQR